MTDNIKKNLDTVRILGQSLLSMGEEHPQYGDYVDRITEAKVNVIEEVCGKDVPIIVENFLINNFNAFMRSAFDKKELKGLL